MKTVRSHEILSLTMVVEKPWCRSDTGASRTRKHRPHLSHCLSGGLPGSRWPTCLPCLAVLRTGTSVNPNILSHLSIQFPELQFSPLFCPLAPAPAPSPAPPVILGGCMAAWPMRWMFICLKKELIRALCCWGYLLGLFYCSFFGVAGTEPSGPDPIPSVGGFPPFPKSTATGISCVQKGGESPAVLDSLYYFRRYYAGSVRLVPLVVLQALIRDSDILHGSIFFMVVPASFAATACRNRSKTAAQQSFTVPTSGIEL